MEELPGTTKAEKAGPFVRGLVGLIPYAGTGLNELYNSVFLSPVDKRRKEFVEKLSDDFKKLEKKVDGLSIENLSENPRFVSAMASGILVATRTHQQEKLNALKNAILNTALTKSPDEDMVTVFLNIVDIFTPWHLKVLAFFENPMKNLKDAGLDLDNNWTRTPIWTYMKKIHSELEGKDELWGLILADLVDRRFLRRTYKDQSAKHAMLVEHEALTPFGRQFLAFIRDPIA